MTVLDEADVWRVLAREWMVVLGGEEPEAETTFVAAGGDSLAATELTERIESSLSVPLSIADVLRSATFADLVQRVVATGAESADTAEGVSPRLSIRQLKMLRTIESCPALGDSRRIRYIFEIESQVDLERLRRALVATVNSEASLLSRFHGGGRDWRVEVDAARDDDAVVTIVDADASGGDEVSAMISDLGSVTMPPHAAQVRFFLLRRQRLLVAVFGHLVFDGMSLPIFLRRLVQNYQVPESRPELRTEYFELVHDWYRSLDAGEFADDAKYWRSHVAASGMWAPVALPSLVPSRPMSAMKALDHSVDVSPDTGSRFMRWCDRAQVPLYFGLLTTAAITIRQADRQDPGFGVEIETSGRMQPGSTSVVGLFTDYVSVHLGDIDSHPERLAGAVHDRALKAVQHGRYPRHLLTGLDRQLMPDRANWLFRMNFDEDRQVFGASSGLLRVATGYAGHEASRVLPGFRLTAGRLTQTGGLRLTMQVGESDLERSVGERLVSSWRQTIDEVGRQSL